MWNGFPKIKWSYNPLCRQVHKQRQQQQLHLPLRQASVKTKHFRGAMWLVDQEPRLDSSGSDPLEAVVMG